MCDVIDLDERRLQKHIEEFRESIRMPLDEEGERNFRAAIILDDE
jgi:hypothetical protein